MKKVTFFDVEYANAKNKSICQMGILCEDYYEKDSFYPELDLYINPEDRFDRICTSIHGITQARVENEPSFDVVWPSIEKYFTNSVVVGHNVAGADLDALVKSLRRYNLDVPELYYIDTYELARTYIPQFEVKNYGMDALCAYFDIDIDNAHNAFDDACANSDLFRTMVNAYHIDIDSVVRKYVPHHTRDFSAYISSPELRKKISELYGMLRGFTLDGVISKDEAEYLSVWKDENTKYADHEEIESIISTIDCILADGVVTLEEIESLQRQIKVYMDVINGSLITLATQILDGIMKGIIEDGEITADECNNLRIWMYDNIYLSGHFPFNRLLEVLDDVLEDGILTHAESDEIMRTIHELLNPVEITRKQIYSVSGKHVCLSGDFAHGKKSDVEALLVADGAIIDGNIRKSTDILMIGDSECGSYSNGNYGTKVKKAMEFNEKGSNILIIKEADYFGLC
ncbi:MAG: hypothetical protein IKP03_06520 [Fibrobacter sp.]|nr:hypothetical protein [Clostridia bacterium]MBR4680741.1 hypothetical protein [Fibrobacter sp.]